MTIPERPSHCTGYAAGIGMKPFNRCDCEYCKAIDELIDDVDKAAKEASLLWEYRRWL